MLRFKTVTVTVVQGFIFRNCQLKSVEYRCVQLQRMAREVLSVCQCYKTMLPVQRLVIVSDYCNRNVQQNAISMFGY